MNFKKSGKVFLPVNLLGPGPRLVKKKNLPGRGLIKVEKHCSEFHWLTFWLPQSRGKTGVEVQERV